MIYNGLQLKNSISIGTLYSVHYFEYMSDFSFEGESHNFWELICVDKGVVNITSETHDATLKKDDVAFHEPNEFHNVRANGNTAPNLVIISFQCDSPAMDFFRKKTLKINEAERNLLANIIMEANNCFDCRLDMTYQTHIPLKDDVLFGSQQLIRLYLEQFLIHLLRRYNSKIQTLPKQIDENFKVTKLRNDAIIFERVMEYMEMHLYSHLTIEQVCRDNLIGRSQLQKIFNRQCDMGIIECFSYLKIRTAKEMIRTGNMNFTQIADTLGYTSIHYFSRQFKKVAGMTPSEYASSIKARAEKPV